jgi:periplasmic protein TonB
MEPAQHVCMMEPKTISAPGLERGRPSGDQVARRGRRFLLIAVALSVAAHVVAALLVVLLPRVLPRDTAPQEQGTVELLMVEQKGTIPSQSGQQPEPQPAPPQPEQPRPEQPRPEQPAEASKQQPPKAANPAPPANSVPAPLVSRNADEPAPPPIVPTPPRPAEPNLPPDPEPPAEPPPPPKSQAGPVIDLAGTESESNAYVLGSQVLPARPDDRFRNRPPVFPPQAAMRGEHGSVVVLIHVSEAGVASGVDVVESSGVEALDQAALDAVRKWHFRPAMQQGRTIPFDMPFRFVFQAD